MASLLSMLFGVPLSHILEVRFSRKGQDSNAFKIWSNRVDLLLQGDLAFCFSKFEPITEGYAFPGHTARKPLSPSTVYHHLRKLAQSKKIVT